MFGRSKPATFKPVPYTRQRRGRRGRRVPRWLLILVLGVALGAGGLWYVEEQHLPPRLSAEASQRVLEQRDDAERQRARLESELKQSTTKMQQAQAEAARGSEDLAGARKRIEALQQDVAELIAALPRDPRAQAIGIRAASFGTANGRLDYNVVFTRERKGNDVFRGALQLAIEGRRASGREDTLVMPAVPLSIAEWEALQGSAPLPDGFNPRQVTIRVLDGPAGKVVSVRVYNVS